MAEELLLGLSAVLFLGIGAQWLAWRIKLPSILLLLVLGFVAGPITGLLDPDLLFGRDLLMALVSLSVAVILFEGGLTLRFAEFSNVGGTVLRLITIGVVVTWAIATLAAWKIVGLSGDIALLLGAILTVTGPTVIGPLLRHVRPVGSTGPILKWEGILVDPVGALLAVLIFEAIRQGRLQDASTDVVIGVLHAFGVGSVVGLVFGGLLALLLWRHWIPDYLQSPASLMFVVVASTLSNHLHEESGLLAVTVMGIALANQKFTPVRHIVEFKENLRVLLISSLFILLAARLPAETIGELSWGSAAFVAILIFVARPLAVFLSTTASKLKSGEKLFLSWMAPRGIVAAAVASIFALRLSEPPHNIGEARLLVPLVFLVIVTTVVVYGLTAAPFARRLGLSQQDPQGVLMIGAHPFARALAKALTEEEFAVRLVDTNYFNITAARMEGLKTWHGNALADYADEEIDLAGIGKLFALTPNEEANSLIALHFLEEFGRSEIYQLPPPSTSNDKQAAGVPHDLRGQRLFAKDATYSALSKRISAGEVIKTTSLTDKFTFEDFKELNGDDALPLFVITAGRRLQAFTLTRQPNPAPGVTLVSLVKPAPEQEEKTEEEEEAAGAT